MPHFFANNAGHIYHSRRAVDLIDTDRAAWAATLVQQGWAPLAAWLFAVKAWPAPLAKAYALLGLDADKVLDYIDALQAGHTRGLLQ